MKKFKVIAVMSTYLTAEIEAENEDQAYEIARDMGGGCFDPVREDAGDWRICDVEEIDD
jgi:hypothetical protein